MAHGVRAWALTQKGDYVGADSSLQEALKLDPNNGIIQAYKAFLYGKMYENNSGPYVDPITVAIGASQAAVTLAPNSLEAHWARGYILQLTDNGEKATQEYLLAIQINPNISEIHLELGVAYKGLGVIDLALQQYTLANTYNPADTRPALYSSRALVSIGEYDKAAQYAESAVANDPTDSYLRGNLGYMLYKINDWVGADKQLSLAIHGGQSDDGKPIPALAISDDAWISRYYYTYAILLALMNRCGDMLVLTQQIMAALPSDEFAVSNSQYAISLCKNVTQVAPTLTPAIQPTSTP